MSTSTKVKTVVMAYRRQIITVVTPLLLLPLPLIVTDQRGRAGYMLILMAIYWCTECLPLPVTGCLPIFLAPMFNIISTRAVADAYLKDICLMFVGSTLVALAVQNSNLHKRVAIRLLLVFGTNPRWLMLTFMSITCFLSMWLCNSATTSLMLPIMEALLVSVEPIMTDASNLADESHVNNGYQQEGDGQDKCQTIDVSPVADSDREKETQRKKRTKAFETFGKAMTLCVFHAANIGGIATLTGAMPNPIMKGLADSLWQSHGFDESPVTYTAWMAIGMPVAIINVLLIWLWLQLFHFGFRNFFSCCGRNTHARTEKAIKGVLEKEQNTLGSISFAEVAAGISFLALVFLFFFRHPGFMRGWAGLFEKGFVRDAVPAMMVASILFIIPISLPNFSEQRTAADSGPVGTLLSWKIVHARFPWSIIFLMGGGFALADVTKVSGLSNWIGTQLSVFGNWPTWLMVLMVCGIVALLTEVTNNAATTTVIMPIMASMAANLGYSPILLMLPTCISTSFAFMLPVASPPNSIAFSYGRLSVMDMVKSGILPNIFGVLTVTLVIMTWGWSYLELDTLPWLPDVAANMSVSSTTKPMEMMHG